MLGASRSCEMWDETCTMMTSKQTGGVSLLGQAGDWTRWTQTPKHSCWRFNVLNSSGSKLVAVAENRGWMERTHKTRWTGTEREKHEPHHPGETCLKEPTLAHLRLRTKWRGADEWTLLLKLIPGGEIPAWEQQEHTVCEVAVLKGLFKSLKHVKS